MNQRSIPIPEMMKHLDVDPRGYAIPWGVIREPDGTAHFAINDELARRRMIDRDLCGLCGKPLFRGRWFIGGPAAAFDPMGAYLDMPTHDECCHYALKVCPFLAAPRYSGEIGEAKAKARGLDEMGIVTKVDKNMHNETRPSLFVAVMAVGQSFTPRRQYVLPKRPYRKVEYWKFGQQLDDAEGLRLSAEAMELPEAMILKLAQSRKVA